MAQTCPNCGHTIPEPEAYSLTPTQRNALICIDGYTGRHGYAPTIREVAGLLSIDICSAWQMIDRMAAHGWLIKGPTARSVRLTVAAREVVGPK